MDTRRCAYCHKLLRADAQICSRCGHTVIQRQSKPLTKNLTNPSLPPASPHLAGHYAGLHPEDQPYQSSKIRSWHAPVAEHTSWPQAQHEPEQIMLPGITGQNDLEADQPTQLSPRYRRTPVPETPAPCYAPRYVFLPEKTIPTILAIVCLVLLIGSSILAFALIGTHGPLTNVSLDVAPVVLSAGDSFTLKGQGFGTHHALIITYDGGKMFVNGNGGAVEASTDDQGKFSLHLHIPSAWNVGQHQIHVTDQMQSLSVSTAIVVQRVTATSAQ